MTGVTAGTHRVVVAGGGFAALEAVLGIRRLAGERVHIDLVTPSREFYYRPLAVVEPFGLGEAPRFDLTEIAADNDVALHVDAVESVDAVKRVVHTIAGHDLPYDSLLVAVGATPQQAVPGAFTYRGAPDGPELRSHLHRIEAGEVGNVVFAVPAGIAWPLPLYEIALMSAACAAGRKAGVHLGLVTAEKAPLALFGPQASGAVERLLRERGVQVRTSSAPASVEDGTLHVIPRRAIPADLVIALPKLRGNPVPGLPANSDGFIPVDRNGGVTGTDGLFAAGDATSFPIKQGGIATQQADSVARAIAARAGAPVAQEEFRPVLRGLLLTGDGGRYMRAKVAGGSGDSSDFSSQMLWWPETKVAGQYLSRYLAREIEPTVPKSPLAPDAIPVDVDVSGMTSGS